MEQLIGAGCASEIPQHPTRLISSHIVVVSRFPGAMNHDMRWIIVTSLAASLPIAAPVLAQASGDARSTQTAYGARLETIGRNNVATASANVNRRLDTRINSRIANRIERYRADNADPATAVAIAQNQLIKQSAPAQPVR